MKIFLGILIFFLVFGWLALLFSAVGLFYVGTIVLSILAAATLVALYLPKISQNIDLKLGKIFFLVIFVSLLVSFATCYFATPTVFGGRDQGSIGTAAIYLSQNHSLEIQNPIARDLFKKYGPGRALNFPGFDYTKNGDLISRFPLGYTAYLASTYTLAGLKGIQYANFVPLFFFLVIFWLILKEVFDEKISFLGFLIAATFFPFLWFAKYALTETYMLFLASTGILFLVYYSRQHKNVFFWLALATFALSALVRIEGIVFFFLAAIYVILLQRKKAITLPKNFKKYLLVSSLVLLGLYAYLNFPDLVDSSKNLVKAFLPNSAKESAPSANLYSYLARIFFNYNITAYIVLGLAGILWLAKSPHRRSAEKAETKNWPKPEFLMIFITFPAFLYLMSPMITLDEPWLLRRFVFAVFPTLIFYSIYFLNKFFYHKIFLYFVLVVLIATNGVVAWRFFTLSENKDLLPQIERISQKFNADDLILVDRLATGSGFSLASEPLRTLYGKQAVYFMSVDDLGYIDQGRYKNIYLIAPSPDENSWYADLIKDKPFDIQLITNNFLEPSDKKYALAVNVESKDFVGIWKIK
ncbi:MAG: hypothetical protein NT093_02160 [Candidatus Moranbacteria bacterium]|nr:hypothetical protein [Candidatus Moranbacteria bacterium]